MIKYINLRILRLKEPNLVKIYHSLNIGNEFNMPLEFSNYFHSILIGSNDIKYKLWRTHINLLNTVRPTCRGVPLNDADYGQWKTASAYTDQATLSARLYHKLIMTTRLATSYSSGRHFAAFTKERRYDYNEEHTCIKRNRGCHHIYDARY